ncbi:DUF5320 domain-containing protein [Rosettibacter firmus]|uniref:DUF5320 domain-containing protein n=1 Tax=Rosettibacter firmus TaxID=3111522 RepID=UPI00336BDB0E
MYGYGKGWHHWEKGIITPQGYSYIGPCRCGKGPHAFYQDSSGRIVHAKELYRQRLSWGHTKEDPKVQLEALKQEKEQLEKQIEILEKQIKENE